MSLISHQDLNSEVLLNFLPMAPGLVSKKWGQAYRMCYWHLNWSFPNRDIFSGFGFLIPQFISDSSNRCIEKETRSKRAKAISFFCLNALARRAAWLQAPGMSTWTDHPSCPETWLHVALRQVFGSVFLFRPSQDSLLAGDPSTIFPKNTGRYSGTYYELDKQWITVPASISQAREGNKYLTSPKQI